MYLSPVDSLCVVHSFYQQLEEVDSRLGHAFELQKYDDGADLTTHPFERDGLEVNKNDAAKLAYRYRRIRDVYLRYAALPNRACDRADAV